MSELTNQNEVKKIAERVPGCLNLLGKIAQALNFPDKPAQVIGWTGTDTSTLIVDKHGFILDSKKVPVGSIIGGNYQELAIE